MNKSYLGIDPGKTGAACLVLNEKEVIFHDFENEHKSVEFIEKCKMHSGLQACIEAVHSMPKNGSIASFKLGFNYGLWCGILAASGVEFETVSPQKWQKSMIPEFIRRDEKNNKRRSIKSAHFYYPDINKKIYLMKHHNRAEAFLLALYIGSIRWND